MCAARHQVRKASPDFLMVGPHDLSPDGSRDQQYISNYATLNVKDVLTRVDGVGDVQVFGARDYSMRVWLDPAKVAARNLTAGDVVGAMRPPTSRSRPARSTRRRPNPTAPSSSRSTRSAASPRPRNSRTSSSAPTDGGTRSASATSPASSSARRTMPRSNSYLDNKKPSRSASSSVRARTRCAASDRLSRRCRRCRRTSLAGPRI
jgi:hypothetical protein